MVPRVRNEPDNNLTSMYDIAWFALRQAQER
jgi:hypothetical protein